MEALYHKDCELLHVYAMGKRPRPAGREGGRVIGNGTVYGVVYSTIYGVTYYLYPTTLQGNVI